MATVGEPPPPIEPPPKKESPTGWGVLLAIVDNWGVTLRTAMLMIIPIVASAVLAIYLGPAGITALTLAGGESARRAIARRRRRAGSRRMNN